MSGGGNNSTTTVTKSDPWAGAQPYLKDVLAGAQGAYRSGGGFAYPGFSTTVPLASQTTQALQGQEALANAGNPLGTASQGAALGVLNNYGLTPFMSSAGTGLQGMLGAGSTPNAISQYLMPFASGANVNGGSPEFLRALDLQSGKTIDDVNRSFSNSGRYGSAAHAQAGADAVGGLRNSAIAQEIARQQGMQMQAAGLLGQEQQTGITNQLGILGSVANLGGAGANNLAQFAQLAPSIYGQQFAPYQQLGQVGAAYQDQSMRELQEQINRFNTTQQEPWARLGAYNALVGGMGQLGQSGTSTVQEPKNMLAPLGGALGGAGIGANPALVAATGGLSIPIGALLGGGLGLLGI